MRRHVVFFIDDRNEEGGEGMIRVSFFSTLELDIMNTMLFLQEDDLMKSVILIVLQIRRRKLKITWRDASLRLGGFQGFE